MIHWIFSDALSVEECRILRQRRLLPNRWRPITVFFLWLRFFFYVFSEDLFVANLCGSKPPSCSFATFLSNKQFLFFLSKWRCLQKRLQWRSHCCEPLRLQASSAPGSFAIADFTAALSYVRLRRQASSGSPNKPNYKRQAFAPVFPACDVNLEFPAVATVAK